MNKEEIIALLSTENTQETIAEQLLAWIKQDPAFFSTARFIHGRTLFHFLLAKQLTRVIEILLTYKELLDLARKPDRNGLTILHDVARKKQDNPALLKHLMDSLPELLNTQDINGETPLHLAVKNNHIDNVRDLVRDTRVNRLLKNHKKKTASDLTRSWELRDALTFVDLTQISVPELCRTGGDLATSARELEEKFPLLSTRSQTTASSSSAHSPSTSPRSVSFTDANESSSSSEALYDEDRVEALKRLAERYANSGSTQDYNQLTLKFCSLCHTVDLGKEPSIKESILSFPGNISLPGDVCKLLAPVIKAQIDDEQIHKQNALTDFIKLLICNGLMAELPPMPAPDFTSFTEGRKDLLEILWLITAGQDPKKSGYSINFEQLNHCALGLQNLGSLDEILIHLGLLYAHFDNKQKMVANYLVWQLASYNQPSFIEHEHQDSLQISDFKEFNINPHIGLGVLGKDINELIGKLMNNNTGRFNLVLLKNWQELQQWTGHVSFDRVRYSFTHLIDTALSCTGDDQKRLVTLIANELKMHSKTFYQKASAKHYGSQGTETAQLISSQSRYFNQLSNYFSTKLLLQPADTITNTLRLLVLLARELYRIDADEHPDLNHLMLILGVLNHTDVSRLDTFFKQLSQEEQQVIGELNRLTTEANCKWMRQTYATYSATLPFLGRILTDYTLAKEGNNNPLHQAEVIGKILLPLVKLNNILQFSPVNHLSDLPTCFNEYSMIPRKKLRYASYRIQPSRLNVIELPEQTGLVLSTLTLLTENYLNNGIIPSIKMQGNPWPAAQIIDILMLWFTRMLSSGSCDKKILTVPFKQTMNQLIDVIFQYEHANHPKIPGKINRLYIMSQISQLEKSVSSGEDMTPITPMLPPGKKSGKSAAIKTFFSRARGSSVSAPDSSSSCSSSSAAAASGLSHTMK